MEKTQDEFNNENKGIKGLLKYKFIFLIFLLLVVVIGLGYFYSSAKDIDRNSYVVLLDGKAKLNDINLNYKERKQLNVGDVVKTTSDKALAVLEWGDGSVTRLGGNTTIKINKLYLSDNLDKINISFDLLDGKTWSTVLSFLGKGSYFNETFHDSVASVRGTVFDIDLDKNYLYVIDHKVKLTNTKTRESYVINEKKPFNIESFDFIDLEIFITDFKDKTWEAINYKIDKNLFKGLEEQIQNDLDSIIDLDSINVGDVLGDNKKRLELYNEVLSDYQKLNFVKPDNDDLFKKKIELKEKLIQLSDEDNKNILLQNTFYDFDDLIKYKKYGSIDEIKNILGENSDLIKKLQLDKTVEFYKLPNDIQKEFNNLKLDFINKVGEYKNIDINKILNNTDSLIQESLNGININFNN